MRGIEASMELRRNERAGQTGEPRGEPGSIPGPGVCGHRAGRCGCSTGSIDTTSGVLDVGSPERLGCSPANLFTTPRRNLADKCVNWLLGNSKTTNYPYNVLDDESDIGGKYGAAPERKGGETGEPREKNPRPTASSSTIPMRENPGVTRPGIEPGSPWWEASRLTAQTPQVLLSDEGGELFCPERDSSPTGILSAAPPVSPPLRNRPGTGIPTNPPARPDATIASHRDEPGSIPGGITPGFSHVGIVSDDAAGRRGFSLASPVHPLAFRRCSILTSLHPVPYLANHISVPERRLSPSSQPPKISRAAMPQRQRRPEVCRRTGVPADTSRVYYTIYQKPSLAAITAATLSGMLSTSVCRTSTGIRRHSSLQPFHELSNGFWPRLTSPHPAIQFVPKMLCRVEVGALGGPV
ncbi:hypothetical protein PR048_010583 [Dryococelus australis]|uniref:Uncharacterized protein n=1 Tax=Dryococelus australis TaxID=614101 RepID=A0ABQ9I345_9NEOP|nr:hypothetical protein PR048_010583 [Dryococelus australis]